MRMQISSRDSAPLPTLTPSSIPPRFLSPRPVALAWRAWPATSSRWRQMERSSAGFENGTGPAYGTPIVSFNEFLTVSSGAPSADCSKVVFSPRWGVAGTGPRYYLLVAGRAASEHLYSRFYNGGGRSCGVERRRLYERSTDPECIARLLFRHLHSQPRWPLPRQRTVSESPSSKSFRTTTPFPASPRAWPPARAASPRSLQYHPISRSQATISSSLESQQLQDCTTMATSVAGGLYAYNLTTHAVQLVASYGSRWTPANRS